VEISASEVAQFIPNKILDKWQQMVDSLAEIMDVPTAMITKFEPPYVEAVRVNRPNPQGIKAKFRTPIADLYCEKIYNKEKNRLLVTNALNDEIWNRNPELEFGYISYLGFPIFLPNGDIFGTICVFDTKENTYSDRFETLILLFKDQIEIQLALLYQQFNLETRLEKQAGELTDTNLKLSKVRDQRKKAFLALRESEARFRQMVESSLVGISVLWEGKHIYQNPEYRRIFGSIPKGEPFPYPENIHAEDVHRVEQLHGEFVCGNNRIFETECRVYSFSTEPISRGIKWVHCRAIRVKYGRSQAVVATVMDITRIKELEVLVGVEDKMSSLGRVATGIAHEMRNPVSAVNVYLAVMQETLQGLTARNHNQIETLKKACRQMQEAANRIDTIVRKVMDFAKPTKPQLVTANLNRNIKKTIDLCDASIRKSNISLSTVLDPNLPKCLIDPHLIEQVLLNLLTNAVRAVQDHDGARSIEMSSQKTNSSIIIRVADSGPGVPEEIRDKIFDPFFTTAENGSGIGLCMSQRIISDHHGTLSVAKSSWDGAAFEIQLPRL
jgi:nitrogen-specific signal transduction histidine kinase/GAF domain-containing protein